ncbi:cytochrome P450 [Trichoderma sp. SZMC 28014]
MDSKGFDLGALHFPADLPALQLCVKKIGGSLIASLAILLLYGLYVLVYRALFHPLAKYPGPFLAKFTNLYSAYHAWKGDIHLDIYRCHQKYGEYLRYAPNRLLINNVNALYDVYGHGAKVKKYKNYRVLASQAPNTLTLSNKVQHARRRRVVAQAFSETSLRRFEPKVQSVLERFCQHLRSAANESTGWTSPRDISKDFNYLAFDTMTMVSFNSDFDTIRNTENRYPIGALEESNVRLGVLLQESKLTSFNLDKYLFPASIVGRDKFVGFLRKLLKKRLQAVGLSDGKDIFSFLKDCKDPDTGAELSPVELSTETALFVVAGSDTTSASLAGVAHYLTGSSSTYRRAAEEVRTTFSSLDEIVFGPKLNSCAYLRAVIDETLRMSPPGGAALWREVETGGAMIDGTYVPEGTDVAVGIYSIHHHDSYYNEPLKFDPERWSRSANKDGTARTDTARQPYMPFSIGSRSCVGKPLALAQIMITFARLLWEFDLRRADNEPGWEEKDIKPVEYKFRDHVSARKDGPVVCFKPRSS